MFQCIIFITFNFFNFRINKAKIKGITNKLKKLSFLNGCAKKKLKKLKELRHCEYLVGHK